MLLLKNHALPGSLLAGGEGGGRERGGKVRDAWGIQGDPTNQGKAHVAGRCTVPFRKNRKLRKSGRPCIMHSRERRTSLRKRHEREKMIKRKEGKERGGGRTVGATGKPREKDKEKGEC